jgi:acetylornithine deacetylase/succinyl-diaminopimelate desuccinylase-like protein
MVEGTKATVFVAHTDTVFPDMEPFDVTYEGDKIFCPGVGDDTGNLAVLLMAVKYFKENNLKPVKSLIFCANSGEEGLGNLKGTISLMKKYGNMVDEFISFDGNLNFIATKTVGSVRYRITVETEGGHSFGNFGNKNAIYYLSLLLGDLYHIEIPRIGDSKTTFNVGTISGGTSVNTIAQNAEMLYEYRSDNHECIGVMTEKFENILNKHRQDGVVIKAECVGRRPCAKGVDEKALDALTRKCAGVLKEHSIEYTLTSSSTDCNIPASMGIPAICPGLIIGGGAHTRGEWIYKSSLGKGLSVALAVIGKYFPNGVD